MGMEQSEKVGTNPNHARCTEIVFEILRILGTAVASGSYDGHDRQFVRQMALLLYLTARPMTDMVIDDVSILVPAMNDDFQMLLSRLVTAQKKSGGEIHIDEIPLDGLDD